MQIWEIGLAVALPVAVIVVGIVILLICYRHRHDQGDTHLNGLEAMEKARNDYHVGIRMLKESSFEPKMRPHGSNKVASLNHHYHPALLQQAFNWREHPSLISEAVEHGWLSFGFTKTCVPFGSSPTNNLLGLYNRFSQRRGVDPEMLWEVGSGVEYVQRMRLNPGTSMKKKGAFLLPQVQSVQCALPLPGPPLGELSFPQEAYFEISILGENGENKEVGRHGSSKRVEEDDDIQLISHPANSEDHVVHMGSSEVIPSSFGVNCKEDVGKKSSSCSSKDSQFCLSGMDVAGVPRVMSVGLAIGGSALYRLPGCDPGSVGFHSTGYVFLNGMAYRNDNQEENKPDSEAQAWGAVGTVIGCGFDPGNKRVFFTLNGKPVYSLNCNSEEFSHPLYPTIATNYDVTVLANFGQNPFEYLPANEQRVANPCFRRPLLSSPVKWPSKFVVEDSGDLFSMDRIDPQWLANPEVNNSQNLEHRYLPSETESDLFEIPLDGNGK